VRSRSCGAFVLVYALMTERHPSTHAGGVIALVNCGIPLGCRSRHAYGSTARSP
jgi:hypothetical protein